MLNRTATIVITIIIALALSTIVSPTGSVYGASERSGRAPVREAVVYSPPVEASIVDFFRPPAHIGAPGNRGLEYATEPGTVVGAAAVGWVTFAGPIGHGRYITIEHADGLRTTYSGLDEVWVVEGQTVSSTGQSLGNTAGNFHFGVRSGVHYLDPEILLAASDPVTEPYLVPPIEAATSSVM